MYWRRLKNCSNIVLVLFFLVICSSVSGQQLDTIYLNLDSLTIHEDIMQIRCKIPKSQCGKNIRIPMVVMTAEKARSYAIYSFKGNGDSHVSKMSEKSRIIKFSSTSDVNWHLSEYLPSADCSKNRQELTLRINYCLVDKKRVEESTQYKKSLKIRYEYID